MKRPLSLEIVVWMAAPYSHKVDHQPLVMLHSQELIPLITIHGNCGHCSFWQGNIYRTIKHLLQKIWYRIISLWRCTEMMAWIYIRLQHWRQYSIVNAPSIKMKSLLVKRCWMTRQDFLWTDWLILCRYFTNWIMHQHLFFEFSFVEKSGLVVSAPAWDGTGCEFDSWQCQIYIPHVHWAYDYLGPFGVLWVHMAWL